MSKRRRSDDGDWMLHHLYMVVDDWAKGYSIYKVDVADFDGDSGADLDSQAGRLPEPPVFRLEFPHDYSSHFAAIGGRIVAMRCNEEKNDDVPVLLLHDTATGGLGLGPRTPMQVKYVSQLVPAFGRLYVTGSSSLYKREDHFEVLAADEKGGWALNAVPTPPFDFLSVTCHAAHPDGHTIFFSADHHGTYSFDTETREWRRRGDWMLPFEGHAWYDGEVDAWVGLRWHPTELGSVCSCDVVSAGDDQGQGLLPPPPAWKLAKEKMVCEDRERILSVALTRMGRGKLCLVELRSRKGVPVDLVDSRSLFYATTFKLRYDKNGGLRATACRTRSYMMPRQSNCFDWWAFGI